MRRQGQSKHDDKVLDSKVSRRMQMALCAKNMTIYTSFKIIKGSKGRKQVGQGQGTRSFGGRKT